MNSPYKISAWCSIRNNTVILNNKKAVFEENFLTFAPFIKALYKKETISYPKFYKMDNLSKLGFLTAELLLKENSVLNKYDKNQIGVVIANSSASLDTDLVHQETIRDRANYFPSPSVFVYTLPNIVIGEICIRNQWKGENAFLVSKKFDPLQIIDYVATLFEHGSIDACLCGWIELLKEDYQSLLMVVERCSRESNDEQSSEPLVELNADNLNYFLQTQGD